MFRRKKGKKHKKGAPNEDAGVAEPTTLTGPTVAKPVVEGVSATSEVMPPFVRGVALYNYVPEQADEIGFSQGDEVLIYDRDASGWWTGECNGDYGLFPGSFVQLTSSSPTATSPRVSPGASSSEPAPPAGQPSPAPVHTSAATAADPQKEPTPTPVTTTQRQSQLGVQPASSPVSAASVDAPVASTAPSATAESPNTAPSPAPSSSSLTTTATTTNTTNTTNTTSASTTTALTSAEPEEPDATCTLLHATLRQLGIRISDRIHADMVPRWLHGLRRAWQTRGAADDGTPWVDAVAARDERLAALKAHNMELAHELEVVRDALRSARSSFRKQEDPRDRVISDLRAEEAALRAELTRCKDALQRVTQAEHKAAKEAADLRAQLGSAQAAVVASEQLASDATPIAQEAGGDGEDSTSVTELRAQLEAAHAALADAEQRASAAAASAAAAFDSTDVAVDQAPPAVDQTPDRDNSSDETALRAQLLASQQREAALRRHLQKVLASSPEASSDAQLDAGAEGSSDESIIKRTRSGKNPWRVSLRITGRLDDYCGD